MLSTPHSRQSWRSFFSARQHLPEISHVRHDIIMSRVQFMARLYCVLAVLWIGIEFICWPWPVSGALAAERLVVAAAFGLLGARRYQVRARGAGAAVLALLLLPAALTLGVEFVLAQTGAYAQQPFGTQAYLLSPILLVASLGIFPLTARESLWLAASQVPVAMLPMILWPQLFATTSPLALMLLLVMIAGIATIASLSQLNFLMGLVEKSAADGLTGAVTRMFGERMLESVFAMSQRNDTALGVLFIDLDRFKSVNDRFGHGAGDDVLRAVVSSIRAVARQQDVLVRWGGEELLLIMPETRNTEIPGFIRRLAQAGIGLAPDGVAITASMGGAERGLDSVTNWPALIAEADRRMYAAKEAGRNRYIGPGGIVVTDVFGSSAAADGCRTTAASAADLALLNARIVEKHIAA